MVSNNYTKIGGVTGLLILITSLILAGANLDNHYFCSTEDSSKDCYEIKSWGEYDSGRCYYIGEDNKSHYDICKGSNWVSLKTFKTPDVASSWIPDKYSNYSEKEMPDLIFTST